MRADNKIKQNQHPLDLVGRKLAKELRKPIIRKFKKRTVYPGFKDNIWGADLADMQLINKFNKGFRCLLCIINIFSKYAWVVLLKDKKTITITNAFQKTFKKTNRKLKKYALIKEVNFTIVLLKNGWKIMNLKCID